MSGANIIGILSTPKYVLVPNGRLGEYISNYVTADFRAITSPATDQGFNQTSKDFAFRYRVYIENIQSGSYPYSFNIFNNAGVHYAENFTAAEKDKITTSLNMAAVATGYDVKKPWGEVIEDRGSQITFSALGQQAPLEEKSKWDADYAKRKKIKAILDTLIPEFSVRMGGATSIDITKPGIDKAYGIRKLRDILGISLPEMIFIGDALFPGGNDYPAKEAGVVSIPVRGPNETKPVTEAIIACLGGL